MKTLLMVLGAATIYVACAVPVDTHPVTTSSSDDHIAPSGSGGTQQPPQARTFADAMSNPVPQADAQSLPVPPDVAVEQCIDHPITVTAGDASATTHNFYAEHLYPGKKMSELSAVRAIVHYIDASVLLSGYENAASTTMIRDGAAAVWCGNQKPIYDRVTFILPTVQ